MAHRHYQYNTQPADHFHPQAPRSPPYSAGDMSKPTFTETYDPNMIPMEAPKTANSFRSHIEDGPPSEAELALLRKLRTLNGGDFEAQFPADKAAAPPPKTGLERMGNPTALSLSAFGIMNTLVGLFLLEVRGVKELNLLVGSFWFLGGMINFTVCIFELLVGNTFAYVIFGTLGGYFMTMGSFLTPAFGLAQAYGKHPAELANAMGIFNFTWALVFILFGIVAIRSNVFMVMIFSCVSMTCVLSGVADFQKSVGNKEAATNLTKVAGAFLLISSIPNWYLLFMILALSSGWKFKPYTGEIGAHKHKAH